MWLRVTEKPQGELTIKVRTYSFKKNWLSLLGLEMFLII